MRGRCEDGVDRNEGVEASRRCGAGDTRKKATRGKCMGEKASSGLQKRERERGKRK